MPSFKRKEIIESHQFYVEQGLLRLLSQFNDIEGDADKFGKRKLKEYSAFYNPDTDNGDALQEAAYEEMCNHYQLLEALRETTRLSLVAGMFHEWEKQIREWITDQIQHWHTGHTVYERVWSANFDEIIELLGGLGWNIQDDGFYEPLNQCRLTVNIFKHGYGNSLDSLKRSYPEFSEELLGKEDTFYFFDYSRIKLTDVRFKSFSDAIVSFWEKVPEKFTKNRELLFPDWFEKAYQKDSGAKMTAEQKKPSTKKKAC
jgi:hypothetical protein